MQRIFLVLAVVAWLLLAANLVVGLSGGDYNAAAHAYYDAGQQIKQMKQVGAPADEIHAAEAKHSALLQQAKVLQPPMTRHMLLGIVAALGTLMVCSISITYFVGTSRWFKEVVDTYRLDPEYVQQSARIKRRSFRWAFGGALAILTVVGLGAASEPTWANARHSQTYVLPHYVAALATMALFTLSFYQQGASIADNGRLIEAVMDEVRRLRQARGLAVEPEPTHR